MTKIYIVSCDTNIYNLGMHATCGRIYLGCYDTEEAARMEIKRAVCEYPGYLKYQEQEFRDSFQIHYKDPNTKNELLFNIYIKEVNDPSAKENKDLQVQVRNLTKQVEYLEKYRAICDAYCKTYIEPEYSSKPTKEKEEPKHTTKFSF